MTDLYQEVKDEFCPPLDLSLVEEMFNERTDDDECYGFLMVLKDNAEAETDKGSDNDAPISFAVEQDPFEQDPFEQDPSEQDPSEQDPPEQDPPEKDPSEQEPSDQDLAELSTRFYDYDVNLLQKILVIAGGELETAIDLMRFIIEEDTKNGQRTWSQVVGSSTSPNKFSNSYHRETGEYSAVGNCKLSVGEGSWRQNASSSKVISASPAYDRDKSRSSQYKNKRDEAFRLANSIYQKTRNRKRNEAHGYYSEQGRAHDAEMKLWILRAARAQVRQKSKARGDPNFVDLHGLTVLEALAVVKDELKRWSSTPMQSGSNKKPLQIITGAGNHSHNNVPRLWIEVGDYLEETNWKFDKDRGSFVVWGRNGSS
ncbi:3086_t:CDS:2 [Paraglomus occultum]|uniref:3086_t:CDS:1 n=1 Tax=Paraglomus occultum TaxID=144539 RepID=A0A9N9B3R3_9GLOM|nr:3086_t:CDS:2 [Paraglomus occultum]